MLQQWAAPLTLVKGEDPLYAFCGAILATTCRIFIVMFVFWRGIVLTTESYLYYTCTHNQGDLKPDFGYVFHHENLASGHGNWGDILIRCSCGTQNPSRNVFATSLRFVCSGALLLRSFFWWGDLISPFVVRGVVSCFPELVQSTKIKWPVFRMIRWSMQRIPC